MLPEREHASPFIRGDTAGRPAVPLLLCLGFSAVQCLWDMFP